MNTHEEANKECRNHLNSNIRIVYLVSINYGKQSLCLLIFLMLLRTLTGLTLTDMTDTPLPPLEQMSLINMYVVKTDC